MCLCNITVVKRVFVINLLIDFIFVEGIVCNVNSGIVVSGRVYFV